MLQQRHHHPMPPVCQRAPLSLSARFRLGGADKAPTRRSGHRSRRPAVAARAAASPIETDAAARVSGAPSAVADYIARVDETWPLWYPRLVSARRTSSLSANRFEVVVRAAGGGGFLPALDLPVEVELLERSPKRVVFAATSPYHSAQEQYVLMPCPSSKGGGPAHTSVRHVSQVRLKGAWATPLSAPVVGALMRSAPQEALEKLAAALMAEEQRNRQRRTQRQHEAAARRGGGGGGGDGGGSRESRSDGGSAFWKGLFGGGSGGTKPPADDPFGMYAALGLDPAAVRRAAAASSGDNDDSAAAELVRAAYRRQAKLLHPDATFAARQGEASPSADGEFLRVQRAYAVLRDAEERRRYDRGEWRPDEEEEGGGAAARR